jgi:hypothetical protein
LAIQPATKALLASHLESAALHVATRGRAEGVKRLAISLRARVIATSGR